MRWCESLPRLQLECLRRPILCNRGRKNAPFRRNAAAFAFGVPQNADFVQSRLGRRSLWPECLPRLQLECRRRPIPCNRGRKNAPLGRNVCRVCSWSAAEGRFCAIAAGESPLSARMLAAFAAGTLQNADFMQSRPEKCPFWPECLPRLHLECRRRPISCNRGRENASSGRNACRVCIWNAAEGRFHAIAAGKTPPAAGMLAAFATGMPQNADFMQSRPENRLFRPECLPRLQLECRRMPFLCNRGRRNAPFRPSACRVHSF